MNRTISTEVVGQPFSRAFGNLICKGNLSKTDMFQMFQTDVMSIWECSETGNKFGYYVVNGITWITERLFKELYQRYLACPKEQKKAMIVYYPGKDTINIYIFKDICCLHLVSRQEWENQGGE